MPKKETIRVEKMAASNPNLSLATRFGNLVFVAGQTGRHPVTGELGKDIREQTRNTLERIKVILAAAGTSLDNMLTATTHLTKREDLAAYNEEYGRYFPDNKPARRSPRGDHRHRLHPRLREDPRWPTVRRGPAVARSRAPEVVAACTCTRPTSARANASRASTSCSPARSPDPFRCR